MILFFFFKKKTAYEMRISDWSSDVCSSDLYENHDSHLSYQRQYYADNKERFRELARQWNRKNKHKRKAIDHRRRVGNGSGKMFSASDVETIMSEQGGACSYCLADLTEYFEAEIGRA